MISLHIWRLVFVALLLPTAPLGAQQGPPADLDEYVARSMKTYDVPGMAIAIVKEGKVVLSKGYGVRKLGEATDASAVYHWRVLGL